MRRLPVLVVLFAVATTLAAHDTWLVPAEFQVQPRKPVLVSLNTGEDFPASESAPAPERIALFEAITARGRTSVLGYRVEGKSLVAEVAPGPGLTLVAAVTHPRLLVLKPEDFNTYITEEHLESIVALRDQRGQTQADGREYYGKIAKLALCAGEASGKNPSDKLRSANYQQPLGLRLEIVPEDNPCELRAGDTLRVRVFLNGQALANVWVGAGYSGVHGHHYPVWQKTDKAGRAAVPLDRPGAWFVRTLYMIPTTEFSDADWQSWFSTFTFAVQ